jgi:YD repeat-containing protein
MSDSFTRRNSADEDKKLDAEVFTDGVLGELYRPRGLTIVESFADRFDYDGSGNVIYHGRAKPGTANSAALWQIRKFSYDGSGNLLTTLWSNGTKEFSNIWDSRAGLSYS